MPVADMAAADVAVAGMPVADMAAADGQRASSRAYSPLSGPLDLRGSVVDAPLGPPKPLTRRRTVEPLEPLDPQYISDSVEARSDWTASAIREEGISSLFRSAPGRLAATANGQLPSSGPNAARRSPMEGRPEYVDRFKATIKRDPEQLRARLSAFQSATARGRAEAKEGGWSGQLDAGPGDQELYE
jgi:hypothetical protein